MKIINRLRKIIAHEKSARAIGSQKEAEVFAVKIQELLDAYNLSLSEIDMQEEASSVNHSKTGVHAHNQWQRVFIRSLARLNGCQIIWFDGHQITLVGSEIDREIVIEIYVYFEKLAQDFADRELKEWKLTAEFKRKRKKSFHAKNFKKSYLLGFVTALNERFQKRHDEALKASSNSTALIFSGNKLKIADEWIIQNIETREVLINPIKTKTLRQDAFSRGRSAGQSVALTTQTICKF